MTNVLSGMQWVEILATAANLIYIVFLIRENIICWAFGIAGSALSVYLFVDARLYSEAFLYLVYAILGVWGWLRWHQRDESTGNPVIRATATFHLLAIPLCAAVALALGYSVQHFSDAQRPLIDASTTVFSLFATYLEINKVLDAWVYWIALNLTSVWLYRDRDLDVYAALIGVYAIMSVWGLLAWRKSYRDAQTLGLDSTPKTTG